MEAKFTAWNLSELVSYNKFGFSPDLDGNKAAITISFSLREQWDTKECLSSGTEGCQKNLS